MHDLQVLEEKRDYFKLIETLKDRIKENRRVLTDPWVKLWCGRRWRNLFLTEAIKDEVALKSAKKLLRLRDNRPPRQKIAERYLKGENLVEWQIEMPSAQMGRITNCTLLFVPGLLNGLLPVRAFQTAFPIIEERYNWKILRADAHPMRSCEANMVDLMSALNRGTGLNAKRDFISSENAVPPGDVFMWGYSKGSADTITLLANHPELKGRVRAVVSWAGAVGGSYTADDVYNFVKDMPTEAVTQTLDNLLTLISPIIKFDKSLRRIDEYDVKGALQDLTTWKRNEFMATHAKTLDSLDIPFFNFTGSTTATEVPHFQVQGTLELNKYDVNNDMQLTQNQAKVPIPMATDIAMFRGHHWDLSYDAFPKAKRLGSPNLDHPFPKEAAVVAMFQFLAELGLID